jgi:hypothetical protein
VNDLLQSGLHIEAAGLRHRRDLANHLEQPFVSAQRVIVHVDDTEVLDDRIDRVMVDTDGKLMVK